jgi:tetratricopeptide (TPR) repeat protein
MRATFRIAQSLATAIVITFLGACAAKPSPSVAPRCEYATRESFADAIKQVSAGELVQAYPRLTEIIGCPQFDQFEPELRHSALLVAGFVAIDLDKIADGHALLVRSSAMPEADADDWIGRLDAARRLGKREDAIESLTQLARRWPEKLQELNFRVVLEIIGYAQYLSSSDSVRFELLDSLYAAKWTLPDGIEPSFAWRDLAAIELDRQDFTRAQEVVSRVQSPHAIVSMRIDRRFDQLRAAVPQYFDVDAAVANQLTSMRTIVQRSPRSLDAIVQLTYSMLDARLYEDVLGMTDGIMQRIKGASDNHAPYDDMDKQIWILDNRARALAALERWSEAEAHWRTAAQRMEDGGPNVSNVINLAWFYAEAGRSEEALATLRGVGPEMSPYGWMQMHGARHAAALHKGDAIIANESFAYLEAHRNDALDTWQWALVRADRPDEAASLLIERLRDPAKRGDALYDLQDFANPPSASQRALWNARWSQIKSRVDVRDAIGAVGRIESFRIPQGAP